MKNAGTSRLVRALQTSSVALGVVVACTVVDKDDYTFRDGDAGAGGESTGGTSGKGGTSGTSGKGGTSGTSGTSGKGGTGGSAGAPEGGEAGAPGGAPGEGGIGGQPAGECGDGTQDPGEDCDDGNRDDEECAYFATECSGCSSSCRRIRPPSCGDGAVNGARPTSIHLQYLATECASTVTPTAPIYLNGVPIPNVPWGAYCLCLQPAPAELTITDSAVLDAVRQDGNVITFFGNSEVEYLAWANMTIVFDNGARTEKVAFDYGPPGDAEARNLGYPPASCPLDFFGAGAFVGAPFGGFPVEQCDGGSDCYSCSSPQCVTLASSVAVPIPDYDSTTMLPGTVQTALRLPEVGTIRDVNVSLNVTHTYTGDLGISIVSPFNSVALSERFGGSEDNFTDTLFDSACTTPIAAGVAPFPGCYAPHTPLDAFNGFQRSFGAWNLRVQDNAPSDTGTLNSWKITVCGAP